MRKLKPYEIEVRVGTISKNKPKAMLLLYKDARCDMSILDEVFGSENWQSEYTKIDEVLYCKIGVYNTDIKEWVWKQSNGIESQGTGNDDPNNKKGEASDAFKRAGFMWGIGRELYEWKGIWVDYDKLNDKYTVYKVKEITYDDNGEPKSIVIVKNYGRSNEEVVYSYGSKAKTKKAAATKKQANIDKVEPEVVDEIEEELEQDNEYDIEEVEKTIKNEIKMNNRELFKNLLFQTKKVGSLYENYTEEEVRKNGIKIITDYIEKDLKIPMDNLELSTTDSMPSLKDYKVLKTDNELLRKIKLKAVEFYDKPF